MFIVDDVELYTSNDVTDEQNEVERKIAKTIVRTLPMIGSMDKDTSTKLFVASALFVGNMLSHEVDNNGYDFDARQLKILGFRIATAINDLVPIDMNEFGTTFLDANALTLFNIQVKNSAFYVTLNGLGKIVPKYVIELIEKEKTTIESIISKLNNNY